ncbi:MAG: M23 family metallopeptidase [Saprospiraceae bacterium]
MHSTFKSFIIIFLSFLFFIISCKNDRDIPLKVIAPTSLQFITIDGKSTAYYEIYLINDGLDTFKISQLSVMDSNEKLVYLTLKRESLINSFSNYSNNEETKNLQINPGDTALIYIVFIAPNKEIKSIHHQIHFESGEVGKSENLTLQSYSTICHFLDPIVVGAPLQSGIFASIYEPSWEQGHRRVIYAMDGTARIPGRYAIDFMQIDSTGKYVIGDENVVANFLGYGANVLAVADGVVASVRSDFSESATLSEHPDYFAEDATGNYISLKIGNQQFAFYEHLQPKSIRVKPGQQVKKGEVIAALGFTGQSTGPHLHFHVADADSPLGAEGIPFVFESFHWHGSYKNFEHFGKSKWQELDDKKPLLLINERPVPNGVIQFRMD